MRICAHAHSETPSANKITKKIRKKQRWPSEKKIQEYPQCSNAYMRTCAHAQRNHSLNSSQIGPMTLYVEMYQRTLVQKIDRREQFWVYPGTRTRKKPSDWDIFNCTQVRDFPVDG
jgi:hypothetical protein